MKKIILILCISMFASFVSAADIPSSEQIDNNKYKAVSKKDWEEYQKYKEEQENSVFISEEEYEKYKEYKRKVSKKVSNEEKSNNSVQKNTFISNNLFVGLDKTLSYDINLKINDLKSSESKSNGWGITAEFGHRENGIMFGAGVNINDVDGSTITNIYPCINLIFPLSDKNSETVIDLFFGGAIGYGHYSEKSNVNDIEISGKGTIFWKLSWGINLDNLIFFMNYSTNHINVEAYSAYYNKKVSGNAKYEKLSIGVGYKFKL